MTTIPQPKKNASGMLWLIVVALLTLVGAAAWGYQATNGMGVTGLTNLETWGLYIAGFVFFVGLSAGALVLAALPVIFDLPRLQPYAKLAAFTSLVALIVGGLFVMMDIGQPMRLWHLVSYGRLDSPLLWDLLLTVVYLVVSAVYFLRLLQAERKGTTPSKWLAYLALAAGLADGLTSFVFATQTAHEFWFSAIQPITFEVAAIASAGGFLLLLAGLLNLGAGAKQALVAVKPLAITTAVLLVLALLLLVSEVVTLAFNRSDANLALFNSMLATPLFWVEVGALLLGIVLLLLPAARFSAAGLIGAGVFTLVGLAAKRLVFVALGFAQPNITYAGVSIGTPVYSPSVIEGVVSIGLVALFALVLTLGFRSLSLNPSPKK